jgi:hypothetical protein
VSACSFPTRLGEEPFLIFFVSGMSMRIAEDNRMARIVLILSLVLITVGFGAPLKAQETGMLSISTIPLRGAVYIDTLLKGKGFLSGNVSAGSHVVSFGEIDGYVAPSPQTVTVIANQTYYVIGTYKKKQTE